MTAEKEKLPDAGLTLAYLTSNLTPSFTPPRPLPPPRVRIEKPTPRKGR